MQIGPREIVTPFRPIPLDVPEGMKPNEFFNSAENLNDLVHNNGLLTNPEGLLLYRKALGHSNEFDASIIYNTSQTVLNPLGRPVRRTQVPPQTRNVWNRMNQIMIEYMVEQYPDPNEALVLAGEASLDATWPLTSPGVPSIRMLHNHFIVFDMEHLRNADLADPNNPNLTDGGQHSLFEEYMHDYGLIERDGDGTWSFVFKNTGEKSFVINRVRSTCGCTVPEWPREPIEPGASGEITVIYDTKKTGTFLKSVIVYSTAANSPVKLQIKGKVVDPEAIQ